MEDVLRGTVVLFQQHYSRVRVVLLKIHNISDVRAAPAIDGLVRVARHAKIPVPVCQEACDGILGIIGILIFINEDKLEPLLVHLQDIGVRLEQFNRFN